MCSEVSVEGRGLAGMRATRSRQTEGLSEEGPEQRCWPGRVGRQELPADPQSSCPQATGSGNRARHGQDPWKRSGMCHLPCLSLAFVASPLKAGAHSQV